MDAFVDINQIGVQDFDTPRTLVRKEQYPHLNSSYLGQNSLYTPMAHRKTSSEIPANTYYSANQNQPGESKRNTHMKSITDKWLRSFSFSRNLTEDEQNAQLLAHISREQQQQQQANLEKQNSLAKNYQTFDGGAESVSPLGIPFVPFAHTKTSFHARARETNFNQNEQQQLLNHTGNFQNNIIDGENPEKDGKQEQLTMLNKDVGLRKYDEKIRDVSDTLAKLRAYKTQLTAIEQQQKFKQQTKRAKSSLSNFNTTQNNSSDASRRLPPIKQQPMMYFSPFESAQDQQYQSTKKRRSKKPKQAGINALAKNILSGLPQEKLANLMAVNMYNKALLKKEENEDKITTVISEQNKLLAKMLDQYDKRVHDTRKQIKLNVARLQSDNAQESRFERDKRNFEKVYSEAQQKFNRECSSLERMPFGNINDISYGDKNTKQLRYIPSHYKKYKSILETKVQQPPMIF